MPTQPIPNKIAESNPNANKKMFNTLLIDGSNALFYSMYGDKTLSSMGLQIGGIFQFLLQIKILLQKYNFRYVYVFWDGDQSGQLRYDICPDYKANRDKTYEKPDTSDYMRSLNERIKSMQKFLFDNKKNYGIRAEYQKKRRDLYFLQRECLFEVLDELYIRQCMADYTEADDFIGYYVAHKRDDERVVILSNDRDLTQLISESVIVYIQSLKQFVNRRNAPTVMGCHYKNIKLLKVLCGDKSDNIKGIMGVGEKTLTKQFPKLLKEEVTMEQFLKDVDSLREKREREGKVSLIWTNNIVNRVTSGCQGKDVLEINEKIVDLSNPLMTDEAKELIDGMMYAPMDSEGRSMENLYKLVQEYDIDMLKSDMAFSSFFREFITLADKEKKNASFFV